MTWLRTALAVAGLAVATVGCLAALLVGDPQVVVDASGHESGPYGPLQVGLCVLGLAIVAVTALRWLPAPAVIVTMPVAFTAPWSALAANAPSQDANLWPVGAMFLFVGLLLGTAVVTGAARALNGAVHRGGSSLRRPSR